MATTAKTTANTAANAAADTAAEAAFSTNKATPNFTNGADWNNAAKDQLETMVTSFTGNFEELRNQSAEYAEKVQSRIKTGQERAAKTNARLLEAAQSDVSDAVQLANDLTGAKSFADAMSIQQSYWTKLLETRMERVKELTEVTAENARETFTPFETPFANAKAFEKFFPFTAKA